jgi:hypothetical protein
VHRRSELRDDVRAVGVCGTEHDGEEQHEAWHAKGGGHAAILAVVTFIVMEINQIKRFIKELEERTISLRGYL